MNKPLNEAALTQQSQAAAPMPRGRAGQATMVEQSRAIAEVQGAIVLAQQMPRDVTGAIADMKQSCAVREMAECAFFKFPRGGQSIVGPSVQLARELARCWGNIDYGIKEMSRDDAHGQSEMLAFAWDLQTNVRAETVFIVPHLRDKRGGPERLTDVRDIYEVNANMGARRLREQIFAVLPRWFTEQAEAACHETLAGGGGDPLPIRISKMVEAFAGLGVTKAQIEKKVGCAIDKLDPVALANLTITFKSIKRGEVGKDDEFPDDKAAAVEKDLTETKAAERSEPAAAPDPKTEAVTEKKAAPNPEPQDAIFARKSLKLTAADLDGLTAPQRLVKLMKAAPSETDLNRLWSDNGCDQLDPDSYEAVLSASQDRRAELKS